MNTDRELMQQALEALNHVNVQARVQIITALRERLAQPEQEPVAWADMDVRGEDKGLSWTPGHFHKTPLYTAPAKRAPLTVEEIKKLIHPIVMADLSDEMTDFEIVRAIEAAHGIKGEA